jgi:hypothetical protein
MKLGTTLLTAVLAAATAASHQLRTLLFHAVIWINNLRQNAAAASRGLQHVARWQSRA